MRHLIVLLFLGLLSGCVTNQLHFASYSTPAQLEAIKSRVIQADIVNVVGAESCTRCSESSKVVWHAANYNVGLYEGFAAVPVEDWLEFARLSVGSSSEAPLKTTVEIDRVFVKTWNSPEYYACEVSLTVDIGGTRYAGWSRLKLKEPGQRLISQERASLNGEVLSTVGLALKAAYIDALDKSKSAH